MKIYTIIGGANGVGKSSLSGVFVAVNSDFGAVVDPDRLIQRFGGDKVKGGKSAVDTIYDCLEREISFTQETTLSGHKTLRTIKAARDKNYKIRLYYIGISNAEESLARIKNRVRKGGHDIPEGDVRRRYEKRFEDLAKILPFCDEAVFFDNENGFAKVAEYKNGEIRTVGDFKPDWLKNMIKVVKN